MAHMLGPGKHAHSYHHYNIGNLIAGGGAPFDANVLAKHFGQVELVSKTAKVAQSSIGGEVFSVEFNMKSSHFINASLII